MVLIGTCLRRTAASTSTSIRFFSLNSPANAQHHKVLVVGAGTAGVTVAAQLLKQAKNLVKSGEIAIIDSSKTHNYQPGWTLVGSGLANLSDLSKPTTEVVPEGAKLVDDKVATFEPEKNSLQTVRGEELTYDYLIVAPGLQINWSAIPGLEEGLKDPSGKVSSIYDGQSAEKTWKNVQAFKGGKALFTQPAGVIKCAGAPQKVMWMALSTWKKAGIREKTDLTFATGMPAMFAVPKYAQALNALREERGVEGLFATNLVSIDNATSTATFSTADGGKIEKTFDLLHAVPPQGPLEVIKNSPLADAAGWVSVDPATLQHSQYKNVFSLGDGSSLPTSKTAAAISGQAPVLVHNLVAVMEGKSELPAKYDGYTSCPLLTGHNELMLAEFVYNAQPSETFASSSIPFLGGSQDKPKYIFYLLKKNFFPWVYWKSFVKGTWFGRKAWSRPPATVGH
ncbi:FAD/NAD(P)-binding domain-containing protein [Meredithblackwellia eburnea MCA 4105]